MYYYYYKQCRDAAWRILLDTDVCTLPVSTLRICRRLDINVSYYDLREGELGRIVMLNEKPHILLRENMSNQMKRFVCAHELGHLMLEHFSHGTFLTYTEEDRRKGLENSASAFAMRIICPACVLWGCNARSTEDISRICGIEEDYARSRLRRMKQLYNREKFLTSSLEREVFDKFSPFIQKHNKDRL